MHFYSIRAVFGVFLYYNDDRTKVKSNTEVFNIMAKKCLLRVMRAVKGMTKSPEMRPKLAILRKRY